MNNGIELNMFSPGSPLGIFNILFGLIFTGIILYIIYAVSTNKESLEDKNWEIKRYQFNKQK